MRSLTRADFLTDALGLTERLALPLAHKVLTHHRLNLARGSRLDSRTGGIEAGEECSPDHTVRNTLPEELPPLDDHITRALALRMYASHLATLALARLGVGGSNGPALPS